MKVRVRPLILFLAAIALGIAGCTRDHRSDVTPRNVTHDDSSPDSGGKSKLPQHADVWLT